MKLIVSGSLDLHDKKLEKLINTYALRGDLFWLSIDGNKNVQPSNSTAISSLLDPAIINEWAIMLIPDKEFAHLNQVPLNKIRVVLRQLSTENSYNSFKTLEIDSYGQLESLLRLADYKGMTQLLSLVGSKSEDFINIVLTNYKAAINKLNSGKSAALFGAQRLGELVFDGLNSKGISVAAFIDNGLSKHGTFLKGVEVHPLSEISDKDIPVVITTTRFTYSITTQLKEHGFKYIIPYSVLTLIDSSAFPEEIPYIGIQDDLADHASQYLECFVNLADDKSRKVLDALLRYRINYDANFAYEVFDGYGKHYFDPEIVNFGSEEVFVDLGGYDGDTVENYINFSSGEYKQIYMFEPDGVLLTKAKERLASSDRIEFVPAGAFSFDGDLRFSASGRTNGSFCESGELVIPVKKIDSVVDIAPTLIKMDIEGAEAEALFGAAGWIVKVKPKLAIAVYHKASDLWSLINTIRSLNSNYKYYLRHYSETGLETVVYAINQ